MSMRSYQISREGASMPTIARVLSSARGAPTIRKPDVIPLAAPEKC